MEPLDQKVCDQCFERNLIEDVHIQKCVACEDIYCVHHASIVDPIQCSECLHDVSMTTEIISKTVIHENKETGEVRTVHSRNARQIKLGGLHWLFIQRKIPQFTEEELALAIEYHRAFYDSLVYEREKRRTETFHRNANKQFKVPSTASTTTTVIEKKKSRTTKILKPDTAAVNIASAVELLLKQGFTLEQITAMAMGKVGK